MHLDLTIANLAQRDVYLSCDDLGLPIAQGGDDRSLGNRSSHDLAITNIRDGSIGSTAGNSDDGHPLALLSPVTVIQVVEAARAALEEGLVSAQSQGVVFANGESAGEEGACLGRAVELELEVRCDISSSVFRIDDVSIFQANNQDSILPTFSSSLYSSLVATLPDM